MYLYILIGILIGLFAGLIPGLHSNTLISMLYELGIPPEILSLLIISLFAAYSITAFIPSIFFGIPDDSSVLSVLPGQRLVKEGRGSLALKTVLFSSSIAVLLSIALFPISLEFFPIAYSLIKPFLPHILILASILLIIRTKSPIKTLFIFILAGTLGHISFNLELTDPFLPLFTGMFAMAAIIAYKKSEIPKQIEEPLKPNFLKYTIIGVFGGMLADLLPGISSPSQVAAFISIFIPISSIGYLATISSVSLSEAIFSLSTSASIHKSRVGAMVWLDSFSPISDNLFPYLIFFLISFVIAALVIYKFRNNIVKLGELNFSTTSKILAAYLFALVIIINGFWGLVIFALGTLLGYLTLRLDVERSILMGAIILPTILLLL